MKRPLWLVGTAGFIVLLHGAARALGWADHTSVVAGMPLSNLSPILGPAFIVLHLVVVIVAPTLAVAALLDALLRRAHRPLVPTSNDDLVP
ncbi:hypothetical protein AKJ09_04085 [Labilithrix luteola]|uniref:Uncharacterized protein n=1 Tax=Labilithrix luteola TaxID=1391654 RepID=A0A0K1PVL9_9BACT|nr:hypothetical protein [Labilithrix luteola]AKU97421.1 hypothetical protein AKJ09_04085 [Labilithrix luteola]